MVFPAFLQTLAVVNPFSGNSWTCVQRRLLDRPIPPTYIRPRPCRPSSANDSVFPGQLYEAAIYGSQDIWGEVAQ